MDGIFDFLTFSLLLHLLIDLMCFSFCVLFTPGSTRPSGPHWLSRTTWSQGKEVPKQHPHVVCPNLTSLSYAGDGQGAPGCTEHPGEGCSVCSGSSSVLLVPSCLGPPQWHRVCCLTKPWSCLFSQASKPVAFQ